MPSNTSYELHYSDPSLNMEQDKEPLHTVDLILGGELIGRAEMTYYSKPFPYYQLSDLYVEYEYSGRGFASGIMEKVEDFLKKKKKPGILVEGIIEGSPAQGMYARRGWIPVPGNHGLHVFNFPKAPNFGSLLGYAARQTDPMIREERKKEVEFMEYVRAKIGE